MDGVSDAGLRMQQIAAQLAALRSGGGPAAAGPTGSTGPSSTTTNGPSPTSSSAGSGSFGAVLADALAGRTGAAGSTASFATTTASLTATSVSAPATTAARAAVSAVSARGPAAAAVSTDLSHYANGRLPAAVLKPLGTGDHRLWAPAADSFKAMAAAASRDGVRLGVNDSYRSYAEQVDMARRKGLYSQGGLAAKPGTSDHGWGKSVDLSLDSRALGWMRAHAGQYGFTANVPRESWHWTYKPR